MSLQDGCFGAATLMRIAALLVPSADLTLADSQRTAVGVATPQSPAEAIADGATPGQSARESAERATSLRQLAHSGAGVAEGQAANLMQTAESECEAIDEAGQFSIAILRCRAVCPDWKDASRQDGGHGSSSDIAVLGIPKLLLQLPATNPANHPSIHPVEVRLSSLQFTAANARRT